MADQATLQARLAEAETALHKLLTGTKAVKVDAGDESVTYTQTSVAQLRGYIAELKSALGQPSGRRAIGVRL